MMEADQFVEDEMSVGEYLEILRRRWWTVVLTAVAVLMVGCVATALMTPIYEAQGKLLVRASASQVSEVNTENPLADLLGMTEPESVDTQIEILRSKPFLEAVFSASGAAGGKHPPQVRVDHVKDTDVIDVTVQSQDRDMVARVANTILDHYLEYTKTLSLQEIIQARQFVQGEEQKAQRTLQRAEDALLDFRRANHLAQLTAEQQNRTQELVDLETKSLETDNNIARVQAQMRELRSELAREPRERIVATGQANPRVGALEARLAEATVERATLLKSYRPVHLKVRLVDASIASLKAQLAAEPLELRVPLHVPNGRYDKLLDRLDGYQTELEGLQAQRAQWEPQLSQQRQRVSQLGPWEVRLAQLQRDQDMAEKSYLSLRSKLQDLQIRENARRSTARIIETALLPTSPVRPRLAINLAVSLALGILLGCFVAFTQEATDDRITAPEEVNRLLGLPVLGYIPAMASDSRLMHALPPYSPAAESYRGLRSSINFGGWGSPLTTLAISSAHAGEGKSTTAINLALAMAMDGRQVILVDADLRGPRLAEMLELHVSPGLTDVLSGQCSLEEALQAIPATSLLVLTSGPVPPNPAELLNTPRMEELIREMRERAHIVIFDTPPCLPVTDAQVLGTKLDGMLLVAVLGEARKPEVWRAHELLEQTHVRVLGVVFNKIHDHKLGCYYRYGYGRNDHSRNGGRTIGNGNGYGSQTTKPLKVAGRLGSRSGPHGRA